MSFLLLHFNTNTCSYIFIVRFSNHLFPVLQGVPMVTISQEGMKYLKDSHKWFNFSSNGVSSEDISMIWHCNLNILIFWFESIRIMIYFPSSEPLETNWPYFDQKLHFVWKFDEVPPFMYSIIEAEIIHRFLAASIFIIEYFFMNIASWFFLLTYFENLLMVRVISNSPKNFWNLKNSMVMNDLTMN